MPGLPKSYIKKWGVTKKAWREYRKKHPKKGSKSRVTRRVTKSKPKKRRKTMVKKKRGRRGKSIQQTVFKYLRVGALVAPAVGWAVKSGHSAEDKLYGAMMSYTGVYIPDGSFHWDKLAEGWMPYVMTTLITKGVQKLSGIISRL